MISAYARDMIGYGVTPPDPRWPDGARLAVNFVMPPPIPLRREED